MKSMSMPVKECYATISLAFVYGLRMLGIFMILPVFTLYGQTLEGATPLLIGLALGVYGLTQACFQIPLGMCSDFFGRKTIIILGLLVFALGSLLAGVSHTIFGVIIGRALQGVGAIGSSLTALLSDLTQEKYRTRAMAFIGTIIALSFGVAMVFGPIINAWIGVPGIFLLTGVLAIVCIMILLFIVPNPDRTLFHGDTEVSWQYFLSILTNVKLLRQDLGIFMLHAILTASFIAIPITLTEISGLVEERQWMLYLPVLLLSFMTMIPLVMIAETKRKMKAIYIISVITITLTQFLLLIWHHSILLTSFLLFFFFTFFIVLEASIPSIVSKLAPAGHKGTALGIYATSQFFGIFIGGLVGGFCFHYHGVSGVFAFSMILGIIWLFFVVTMPEPQYISNHMISLGRIHKADGQHLQDQLTAVPGVIEVFIDYQAGVAHLKIDKAIIKPEDLQSMTVAINH